jgi:hypothetical protein
MLPLVMDGEKLHAPRTMAPRKTPNTRCARLRKATAILDRQTISHMLPRPRRNTSPHKETTMAKGIPEGLHSVTPAMTIDGCAEAIEFYKKAFGAVEIDRAPDPSGKKIWHAQIRIGNSAIFVNDVFPEMGSAPGSASL